ncbi:hypothetical protein KOEU_28110 [Komagataeibacter europaeus]|uniref:Uncharacterized protein n=1 Tax=Komagataeibacter europaeus TaxID=33995 RepID=A0A0M0EEH9_KOMEU|nr:hypothetical protein KOEU_28110 [Komagataeibacter europaeus]
MRALPWRNMAAAGPTGPIVCYDILISNIYEKAPGGFRAWIMRLMTDTGAVYPSCDAEPYGVSLPWEQAGIQNVILLCRPKIASSPVRRYGKDGSAPPPAGCQT